MRSVSIALAVCLLALPAFAGNAESLTGRWPFEVAANPEFRQLVGEALAKRVEPLLETGSKSEAIGGRWLVVEGCRPHSCDAAAAFIVMDGETGGMKAWTTTSGKAGVKADGNPSSAGMAPPRGVAVKLDEWRSRLR